MELTSSLVPPPRLLWPPQAERLRQSVNAASVQSLGLKRSTRIDLSCRRTNTLTQCDVRERCVTWTCESTDWCCVFLWRQRGWWCVHTCNTWSGAAAAGQIHVEPFWWPAHVICQAKSPDVHILQLLLQSVRWIFCWWTVGDFRLLRCRQFSGTF